MACMATGCASVKTLEELEMEAAVTGDWSEVEKRERLIARRNPAAALSCPTGYVAYCEKYVGDQRCGCVSRRVMQNIFAGR